MTLHVHETVSDLRAALLPLRLANKTVGLVPTMGALHRGHASLVDAAAAKTDVVVASIFVNPTQFAPGEDLDRYPRTFDADCRILEAHGCQHVFFPSPAAMYPAGFGTSITLRGLTDVLCGASRPTHFAGVLTVVLKLLNIALPDVAFFGRKDFQQALVIRRMVADLNVPVRIETCPIVREPDGLALSSRNRYLGDDERRQALALREAVLSMDTAFRAGLHDAKALLALGDAALGRHPLVRKDYLDLRDPSTLEAREGDAHEGDLVAVAAHLGQTRLIDNGLLGHEEQ